MLAKKPLTTKAIASLKPAASGKRRLIWDAIVPGLAVRVTDRGARSFVLVTRYPGSKNPAPRRLGAVDAISLETARLKAKEWLNLIGRGIDPEAQAQERRSSTLAAIAEEYFRRKAKNQRSRAWAEATLSRLVLPTLGSKVIDEITRTDIVRLLDQIEDERGPIMANRTLDIIGPIFNFHASRSDTFRSPLVRGMARPEIARTRVLTDDELRAIWKAAGEYHHPFGRMLRFILLTATRRNEAAHAKREELSGTEWTIPAARYKTNLDHLIPLSDMALAEISGIAEGYLFTTNGRPMGGLGRHKEKIDELSGVTGWVIHDLRRTARSLMSRAGVPSDHAERCLGHVIGGVRGVYDRHAYRDEKLKAFEALASLVNLILHPTGKVVSIRR